MNSRIPANARGFTLIEMAIVLVVIGLLLGGVLFSGGFLRGQGTTIALLSKIQDLAAASRQFKENYSYYPGDLPGASAAFPAISAGCNIAIGTATIGNGIVDDATESSCALEELVLAGMLSKIDYDAVAARYRIQSGFNAAPNSELSFWFNADNTNAIRITGLPCTTALEVDRKLDNASPANTPLADGDSVRGFDAANAAINTCVVGGANDPVPTLLVRY